MFIVALTELTTSVEAEAVALANDLGSTPYEQRLALNQGAPVIALRTPDRERAVALLRSLRSRGHRAEAIDGAAVVTNAQMPALRFFRLTAEGILRDEGAAELLPYSDLLALVRANQREQVTIENKVKEKKFSLGRAALTGGISMRKKVTRTETSIREAREDVLYMYRHSGAPPWILRTGQARYSSLGADLKQNAHQNFVEALRQLRRAAPAVPYDERLVRRQGETDLLAHLIALTLRAPG